VFGGRVSDDRQQYEIASDVDLYKYRAVVIWCRAFSVAFGKAALGSAG
jgi:hypothetical protein